MMCTGAQLRWVQGMIRHEAVKNFLGFRVGKLQAVQYFESNLPERLRSISVNNSKGDMGHSLFFYRLHRPRFKEVWVCYSVMLFSRKRTSDSKRQASLARISPVVNGMTTLCQCFLTPNLLQEEFDTRTRLQAFCGKME